MSGSTMWLGLGGVFVGGALPWLEAVVVIPAGIFAGLPPVATIVVGAAGNVLTVAIAAFGGQWLRQRWHAWRKRKTAKHRASNQRLMNRGGLPLLALLGPLGFGTQASALIAVSLGSSATRAFTWIASGTVTWCVIVGIAANAGIQLLG